MVSTRRPTEGAKPAEVAQLLASRRRPALALPEGGTCSTDPTRRPTPRSRSPAPAMLDEVDLPPVPGIDQPWVGTEPRKALDNAAATHCDGTDFTRRR